MTLDFDCDSKDMDPRSALLLETASVIYHLVIEFAPDLEGKDESVEKAFIHIGITKAVDALQLISGIDRKDATECVLRACERESNQRQVEYIKTQMGWEAK